MSAPVKIHVYPPPQDVQDAIERLRAACDAWPSVEVPADLPPAPPLPSPETTLWSWQGYVCEAATTPEMQTFALLVVGATAGVIGTIFLFYLARLLRRLWRFGRERWQAGRGQA